MAYTPVLNPQPIKVPDVATTGTMAVAAAAVVTAVNSQGIVAIQLTGTWVGSINFQGTEDPAGITAASTSWFNVNGVASVTGLQVTAATANGQFRVNSGGYTAVRAIMTTYTSGTATAWLNASLAPSMATLAEPLPIGTNTIGNTRLSDGVTAALASVAPFHNTDNQGTSTGNAVLTGGIAQLLNINGNLDRQRATGSDGISALGVATGSAQFAMTFKGTIAATITLSASPQVITPFAMTGNVQGVNWSIVIGTVLTVDTGATLETVLITAITSTTFTAIFAKSHSAGVSFTGYVYNQERDAAGELDGATGAGTAVAVGYEYNGGHPDGIHNYDRERNLNAKGHVVQTITATTVGQTSITAATAPTGLEPGELILISTAGLATPEVAYVASNYLIGSTTIPLAAPLAVAGNTFLHFEQYAPNGPGTNGLLPFGIGIEEDVVFDPVTGLFYIERSATQDGVPGANLPMVTAGLYNGATFDRPKSIATGIQGVGLTDGTNSVSVKAASTAAVVTDKSLVTAFHPSSSLPGGINSIGLIGNTSFNVTQGTGTNLHTVVDSGTITAVTAITNALPTGTNIIGKAGIDQTTPGNTNNVSMSASTGVGTSNLVKDDTSFGDGVTTGIATVTARLFNGTTYDRARGDLTNGAWVNVKTGKLNIGSATTGGLTTFTLISTATTNATNVKATAGTVYSIQASNTGAAVAFLKLYNLAVAPTVGTSVAVKTLIIPVGGGIVLSANDIGIAFTTGIAIATTGIASTADTTAVALNQVVINVDYN